MFRSFAFFYGTANYAMFLLVFLYAIGFVSGVGVPWHVDNGVPTPWPAALAINLVLLSLFAVQHSGMARPAFKRWFTRIVPAPLERSTFVLATNLVLVLLYWQWRPLPMVVWNAEAEAARWLLHGLAAVGWLLVLASTFLIDHFDLFGVRQSWRAALGRGPTPSAPFVTRALYRIVRHPIMLGFLIAFWATPTMTVGHLLFAGVTTGYILVAVKYLEERDLVAQFGDTYREYQLRVPMLLPWRRPVEGSVADAPRMPARSL
ncbi:methanethiol S-methyltransferase [Novilysobacter spongiicola]|uniref:methanethiol S-methyltransferase n=1 Tax=Lysobacter spongiicola DSM 21749 TaxID=1122188 RepID=A0A1T4RIS5_9GAMM|nr:methanethiol S-methyltransferase [Lysobacter spongiicola]SKA15819.1 Protein-S-isoprenylcysteine O-methyltransferase Ste14 [Lysobacter spongiicola DSM 21749]